MVEVEVVVVIKYSENGREIIPTEIMAETGGWFFIAWRYCVILTGSIQSSSYRIILSRKKEREEYSIEYYN